VQKYKLLVEIVLKERIRDCNNLNSLGVAAYLLRQANKELIINKRGSIRYLMFDYKASALYVIWLTFSIYCSYIKQQQTPLDLVAEILRTCFIV
jgi:hypothetical protein